MQICNKRGLHARASAKFVNAVAAMEGCTVKVTKDGGSALGASVFPELARDAAKGDTIEICVEGDQAEARLSELVELVSSKFGED